MNRVIWQASFVSAIFFFVGMVVGSTIADHAWQPVMAEQQDAYKRNLTILSKQRDEALRLVEVCTR